MRKWETAIDTAIRKAMEAGEFDNLPGEGRPLDLNSDTNIPSDMRLAYKIMKENGIAPDWVMQGKMLTAKMQSWQSRLKRAYQTFSAHHESAKWHSAREQLILDAEQLNKEIISFNLKLPAGIAHRPLINVQSIFDQL